MKRADFLLGIYILIPVVFLIIPIPTGLLDVLMMLNLALALTILFTALFSTEALHMSAFPTLLLMTTLFRISLNVGSTRNILLKGYAGRVVTTFGNFVGGGNLVVGAIVFLILIIVQFIVINKGSERVSEVTARFTLDAMPGKQMAIDADLNTGAITDEEAKERRQKIQDESTFFGAMDGATKYVKESDLGNVLLKQLFSIPKVLYIVGITMALLGLTPLPTLICFIYAVLFIAAGRAIEMNIEVQDIESEVDEEEETAEEIRRPENVVSLLQVDPIELEFGYGIIPLADVNQGGDLLDRGVMIRRQDVWCQ